MTPSLNRLMGYKGSDMTKSTNAERLKKYRIKMEQHGFRRLSFYACRELCELLDRERQPYECGGRVLERLLLGQAAKRPDYYTPAERALKRQQRAKRVQRLRE